VVSIGIPCYNQAAYLGECLQSLQCQTFKDWEAVVVDDASTEGGIEQLVSRLKDPRVRIIRHERNRGLAAARNTAFQAASAELVLPLDSGDRLDPSYLEVTVGAFEKDPDIDCVFTDLQLFGASHEVWQHSVRAPQDILKIQWIPGAGTLMNKRVWSSVGGYSEIAELRYGNEDWDFWIAAIQHGIKAFHIAKPIYMYRRYPESMSVSTLQYYDYVTREIIYQRQQAFFDSYNAGARFRAEGYFNSSVASLKRGERLRAVWLALHGLTVEPGHSDLHRQLARCVVPDIFKAILRQLRKRSTL
jgi:glycosyltransferase involved in cell wall biosynthesis